MDRNKVYLSSETWTKAYWKSAAAVMKDTRMFVMAALILALRVAVKFLKVPIAEGVSLAFDCYVNAVGATVYGPLMALAVGAVSDTLGCIVAPSGPYFLPFIVVEMLSGFIFGLFLWRKKITVTRVIWSKFTVNFVCNIILTSLLMKWYYYVFYGPEKIYNLFNLVRVVKNLVLFPLEAGLITLLLQLLVPHMAAMSLVPKGCVPTGTGRKKMLLQILLTFLISVAVVLIYIFVLKDPLAAHNIKLF